MRTLRQRNSSLKDVAQTGADEEDVTDKEAGMSREDVTGERAVTVRKARKDRAEEKRSVAEEAKQPDGCQRMSEGMAAGTAAMLPCGLKQRNKVNVFL